MDIIEISVPDMNDSFSRVVLDGKEYLIRFTWNATAQRWSFGLYTMQSEPIAVGIRIVPQFPLTFQVSSSEFPPGEFFATTRLDRVGRNDFVNGNATFAYISRSKKTIN